MENKQELKTISFQLESKCKRTHESVIAYVPKFNVNEKETNTKYQGQIKVSLNDLSITDTYFKCKDNTLLNVPFEVIKGLTLATIKAFYSGKDIKGCGCSVSGYKGKIESVNEDNTFNISLDRDIYYIIQD